MIRTWLASLQGQRGKAAMFRAGQAAAGVWRMGMISHWQGWFSLALCVVLLLKYDARKLKISSLNLFFRRLHIPCGVILLITAALHGVIAVVKFSGHTVPVITGIVTGVLILFIAASYLFRKKLKKKWMLLHRVGTVVLLPAIFLHVLSALL